MTGAEYKRRLYRLKYTCSVNQRYHQTLQGKYGCWDKAIRIAVGLLATAGLVLCFPWASNTIWPVTAAIISLAAAVVLNIVPVGDWEKRHAQLFRLWAELRKDAELEENKTCEIDDEKSVPNALVDRLCDLNAKEHSLDSEEPAPDKQLLIRCQGDQNESEWGEGIRTTAQVEAERARRFPPPELTSPSEVASAAEAGQE